MEVEMLGRWKREVCLRCLARAEEGLTALGVTCGGGGGIIGKFGG